MSCRAYSTVLAVALAAISVVAADTVCPDADGDGICDASDNCVDAPNPNQTIRLSGDMVAGGGVAYGFDISATGASVVYQADQETDGVEELYAARGGGGDPVKLNATLVTGGGVRDFAISPDEARVVYSADQDADEMFELYSVPIGGGTATKLNGLLVAEGDVYDYLVSPDGSRVVYRADQDTDDVYELYSVPIGGGTPVRLIPAMPAWGDVQLYNLLDPGSFAIAANGSRVVYRADRDTNDVYELYSVPIASGPSIKLSPTPVTGGDVLILLVTPDGAHAVFVGDLESDGTSSVYSVPVEGGTAVNLSGPALAAQTVPIVTLLAPDGPRVVFRASQYPWGIYSVPLGGGSLVFLASGSTTLWGITPDGDRVVYGSGPLYSVSAELRTGSPFELFSSPLAPDAAGADDDADGFGGACDCSVADPDLWSVSGATGDLLWSDRTQLAWQASDEPGGTGVVLYDVLRSKARDDFTGVGTICVESDDDVDQAAVDTEEPSPGQSFHYLIRAENGCGGTLGASSEGVPRTGRDCP